MRRVDTRPQRAVALLKAEGFVVGQQGKALLIRAERIEIIDASPYREPAVTHVDYEMLHVGHERPPMDAARIPGLTDDQTALLRKRLTLREGDPLEMAWSYYPTQIAAGTALARPGFHPHEFVDEIQVRQPTTEELETLELPAGVPVMRTLRTITDQNGTVVEVTVIVKGGHVYGMRYRQT